MDDQSKPIIQIFTVNLMWKSKLCTGLVSEMTDSLTSRMTVKVAQHVDNKNFSCPWVHKKGGLVLSSQEKKRCTPTCQYTQSLCNPSLLQKQTGTRSHSPPYSCIMPRDSVTDQRKIKGDVNLIVTLTLFDQNLAVSKDTQMSLPLFKESPL